MWASAWQAKTGKKMTKTASLRDLAWFEYVGGTQGVLMRTQGIDGGQRTTGGACRARTGEY